MTNTKQSADELAKPDWYPWNDDPNELTGWYDRFAMDAYLAHRDKQIQPLVEALEWYANYDEEMKSEYYRAGLWRRAKHALKAFNARNGGVE